MRIYKIETEGFVSEEFILNEFIDVIKQRKEYELFKKAIVSKEFEVKND